MLGTLLSDKLKSFLSDGNCDGKFTISTKTCFQVLKGEYDEKCAALGWQDGNLRPVEHLGLFEKGDTPKSMGWASLFFQINQIGIHSQVSFIDSYLSGRSSFPWLPRRCLELRSHFFRSALWLSSLCWWWTQSVGLKPPGMIWRRLGSRADLSLRYVYVPMYIYIYTYVRIHVHVHVHMLLSHTHTHISSLESSPLKKPEVTKIPRSWKRWGLLPRCSWSIWVKHHSRYRIGLLEFRTCLTCLRVMSHGSGHI